MVPLSPGCDLLFTNSNLNSEKSIPYNAPPLHNTVGKTNTVFFFLFNEGQHNEEFSCFVAKGVVVKFVNILIAPEGKVSILKRIANAYDLMSLLSKSLLTGQVKNNFK